jgi:protein-disulfide isomerase
MKLQHITATAMTVLVVIWRYGGFEERAQRAMTAAWTLRAAGAAYSPGMATSARDLQPPDRVPANVNAAADGIVVGDGPVVIDAFEDFQCPFCRMFEEQSGAVLRQLAVDHVASLVYHPLAFLDAASTTRYSSRASSASGCAADAGRFADFHDMLYINQPPEGSAGLSDDELIEIGASLGVDDPDFPRCVSAHAYLPWTAYVTARAIAVGVQGTPTVMVNGTPVPANAGMILAAAGALVG